MASNMSQNIAESVQDNVRLGMCHDTYYYTQTNSFKQCYAVSQTNKFFVAFSSLSGGGSQCLISPNQGIESIIVSLSLPSTATYTGCAVNRAWGYALLNNLQYRYAGSSQYQITGNQLFIDNLRNCTDSVSRDFLAQLGGAQCLTSGDFAGDNLNAYLYLALPHSSPNGGPNRRLPFPSDLLVQPIIITFNMNPVSSIFSTQSGAVPPTALSYATFQVNQIMFNDSQDMLARREDMNVKAYSYPITFLQNEYNIGVTGSTTNPVQVNLTGFRAGEVKYIVMSLTRNSDIGGATQNPFAYQLPSNITMSLNGNVIFQTQGASSLLWNLIQAPMTPGWSNSYITSSGGSFSSAPVNSYWVVLPFAQYIEQVSGTNTLIHGTAITNAIVNLSFTTPENVAYTAHFTYYMNSVLLCNRGSTDYVF